MSRVALPQVTLCAATSVNVAATLAAMRHSMALCDFGAAVLLTDRLDNVHCDGIAIKRIAPLTSAVAYSRFILSQLSQHISTSHVLVVQWDGFVVRPAAWDPIFLEFDYIGAVWPQFDDGVAVGNGGFSLRSKRLLDACRAIGLTDHPEDVAICRTHRSQLEQNFGIRFADPATAARFSYERSVRSGAEFGFHGAFNLPAHLGPDGFWRIYEQLDDRRGLAPDFRQLLWTVLFQPNGLARAWRMLLHWFG
jgi:hypothetical protein